MHVDLEDDDEHDAQKVLMASCSLDNSESDQAKRMMGQVEQLPFPLPCLRDKTSVVIHAAAQSLRDTLLVVLAAPDPSCLQDDHAGDGDLEMLRNEGRAGDADADADAEVAEENDEPNHRRHRSLRSMEASLILFFFV
mmetsp:Transcript_16298/g.23787  ORF Transcript_16298/g.23787 Transcript_16298/m.23787 type:complete len:138 (-) Transcript_16298:74-487(-)